MYLCPDRKQGAINCGVVEDYTSKTKKLCLDKKVVLKEGSVNRLQLTFRVINDFVWDLKLNLKISGMFMTHIDEDEVMGSFSPKSED